MLDTIDGLSGDHLELDPYQDDFNARLSSIENADVWKLERKQDFHQPESGSWMAFHEGRRKESIRLLEKNRSSLRKAFDELSRSGCRLRWVRVVEKPFTIYLLWELHSLYLRAQCGEDVRVVSPAPVAKLEGSGPLPELVALGDEVMYKILYDTRGVLQGGERFTDPSLTTRCRSQIAALHEDAEPLEGFFTREVGGTEATRA